MRMTELNRVLMVSEQGYTDVKDESAQTKMVYASEKNPRLREAMRRSNKRKNSQS